VIRFYFAPDLARPADLVTENAVLAGIPPIPHLTEKSLSDELRSVKR
jgi:hypothetical protein